MRFPNTVPPATSAPDSTSNEDSDDGVNVPLVAILGAVAVVAGVLAGWFGPSALRRLRGRGS